MDDSQKEEIKKQMKKIYYYRDMMENKLAKKELEELLVFNEQEIPTGVDKVEFHTHGNFYNLQKCRKSASGVPKRKKKIASPSLQFLLSIAVSDSRIQIFCKMISIFPAFMKGS